MLAGACLLTVCNVTDVFLQALEKAKEAGRKERALVRQREQSGNAEHINLDLTYSVSTSAVLQMFKCCIIKQYLHDKPLLEKNTP